VSGIALASLHAEALRHNLARARVADPAAKLLAVIKADAYGHGMLPAAEALSGAEGYAVARVEEGVALREAGATKPILVLGGFYDQDSLEACARHRLDCALHDDGQLRLLERHPPKIPLRLWLKLDSGMHRLGFDPGRAAELTRRLDGAPGVVPGLRYMTHFANADDRDDDYTARQVERFKRALVGLAGERSLANSAALLAWPEARADWARPGIMLYGCSPLLGTHGRDFDLRPVMTLETRLIAVRQLDAGEPVGYSGIWRTPAPRRIAVAAMGYGDGYPRVIKPDTPVLVAGRRAPIVGRVSMDTLCIDVTQVPEAEVGARVVLWGEGLPVEEIAVAAGTIPYELLCRVSRRVRRVWR
jgi:alanine racemase